MSKEDIKQAINRAVQTMPHGSAIQRVRLFGSHLHGDAKQDSDVDLIIDFDQEVPIGFFALFDIEEAFRNELKRDVDITTPNGLKKYIRNKVLNEAETLYERKG